MKLNRGYEETIMKINTDQRRLALQGKHVQWETYFKSENEIEETLKSLDIEKLNIVIGGYRNLVSGYMYIISFVKQLQKDRALSDKQMVQCKRLASEIYKAKILMEYIY